jgi:D-beta-D-heptose 7-phosphate kinase/D-beta-D-heptose 1-phosphate adenosyltransferase
MVDKEKLLKVVDLFNKKDKTISVIGDLILDRYIIGKVRRISPEAPVPVVEVTNEKKSFGGAANVANNISSAGGKVRLISIVGNDRSGETLFSMLREKKLIDTSYIIVEEKQKTTEKIRIIAEHQQVVRVDREIKYTYNSNTSKKIKELIEKSAKETDAFLLSDYGKGILSKEIIEYSIKTANRFNIPIFVDPKIEHFSSYKYITSMTPNVNEAFSGMRSIPSYKQEDVEMMGKKIVQKLNLKSLIITQSENGMTVFDNFEKKLKITHIPTKVKEVFDVTGAGDTVISILALSYSITKDILISAIIANYAAGIVVSKLGTATVSIDELKNAIKNS